MKVRLTALSMSSTHMKMMIALRRVSTPTTPIVNRTAEKNSASASNVPPRLAENDRADEGDEQEHARDLERQQVLVEQRLGDRGDRAPPSDLLRGEPLRQLEAGRDLRPTHREHLREDRQPDRAGGEPPAEPPRVRGLLGAPEVEQHDHEQEHDHDGARVDENLDGA